MSSRCLETSRKRDVFPPTTDGSLDGILPVARLPGSRCCLVIMSDRLTHTVPVPHLLPGPLVARFAWLTATLYSVRVKFMTVHTPESRPRTSPGQPLGIPWSSQVFPGSSPAPNTPHLRHPQKRLTQSWYGVCVWRMSLSLACVSRPRVFPQSSLSLPFRAARPPASSPGVPNFHRLTPVSVIGGCPGVVTQGWGPS